MRLEGPEDQNCRRQAVVWIRGSCQTISFLSERHWITPTLAELTLLDSSCASTTPPPPAWPHAPSCALLVRVTTVFTMGAYYDEVEIEDMAWDEEKRVYHYPCPCGDRFEISRKQLANYEDIATCPSCSLVIRVIYDPVRGLSSHAAECN